MHVPPGQVARDFVVPGLPGGGKLANIMLLVIGIVGTTVAPWQLFFQQSYVIDKRITPRFISYEKADLWIGIVLVVVGAVAMMALTAAAFAGHAGGRQLHRRRRRGRGLRKVCRPGRRSAVRDRADRRGDHRRVGGVALDRLRDRRRAVAAALAAPQGHGRQGLLPRLLRR